METKYVRVPFEVELAKKITNGEIGGRIVTRNGESARIVCFDRKDEFRPIFSLVHRGDIEIPYAFCLNGKFVNDDVLDTHDLMLEIPEYMTFKDGGVYKTEKGSVAIYNGNYQAIMNNTPYYVGLRESDGKLIFQSGDYGFGVIQKCTLDVTKEEKQKLIDALKASNDKKAKAYLERFFPNNSNSSNIGKNYEFKPFDKVLVRDNRGLWFCSLFSHISKKQDRYKYITVTGSFENCIPYNDKTAHLLGATENYE